MPTKAKRPCKYPGCPKLTDRDYCEEHAKLTNSEYNRYRRDPESSKQHGRRWRKIRDMYARQHPLCEDCLERGLIVPMDEVHHMVPLSLGGTHEFSNLRSLCQSCHQKRDIENGVRRIF